MIGFDLYSVSAWLVDGFLVRTHATKKAASQRARNPRRGEPLKTAVTVGLFTLGVSAYSLDLPVGGATISSLSSAHVAKSASTDHVPDGYWGVLQTAMKRLPHMPETPVGAGLEFEPYV